MFEQIAERKIREAMARGEFDNLPGRGEPIDHSEYFAVPEHLRAAYAMLKKNGFVPEEVLLLREINETRENLESCEDPERRRKLETLVNAKLLKLDMLREHARRARRAL